MKTTEPSRSLEMLLLSSDVIAISHHFTSHVKLISILIPATPSIMPIITIVHRGHVPSTTSVESAALGHLCFVSCDRPTLLPLGFK